MRRKRTRVNRPTKRYVKSRILASTVTRHSREALIDNVNFGGPISGSNVFTVTPSIPLGDGFQDRTELRVKLLTHKIKMWVRFTPNMEEENAASIMHRIICASPKRVTNLNDWLVISGPQKDTYISQLLLDQNTTPVPYSSSWYASQLPLNSKQWKKHYDRNTLHLGPVVYKSFNGSATDNTGFAVANGYFRLVTVDLKPRGKILKYSDLPGQTQYPMNYNPMLMLGFTNLNRGLDPDTSTRMNISAWNEITYKIM